MRLFSKNRYYIKLYVNRIEIKDLINGKTLSENSQMNFNNQRLLIADFAKAENFVKTTFEKFGLSTRNSVGIIQQMEMSEGGLSEVEKRVLFELFSTLGINQIHIDESLVDLTEKKLAEF
ncbi:hypothetical protein [Mangrovimonas aestuarii]|uniref:hypothetical protein n=1 Tax=Mangrovimonas aestuarii TaxID=3018443 RepID=UPI0023797A5B|nr:hypothetical protein [Mangrovimonas aestuarii]